MMSALLVGFVALFGFLECAIGNSMVQRPIVMGPLVGLVLGDLQTGLLVGATLELAFMGNVTIGAALPPEITAGGILGTAFAITSGSGADVALALALPIATVALLVKNTYYLVVRSWFLHRADRYVEAGDDKGVARMHLLSFWSYAIVMSVIIAACFYAGSPAVEAFLAVIPQFVKDGLSVAAGILPALGFALLASMLVNKRVAPYFFLGFLLSAYLKVPVLGIAMLGIIIALILTNGNSQENAVVQEVPEDEDF